ncbi:MAG: hypothetical protein GY913_33555 [Proteobacteria bacterium]|nr:hypothetical protein [Pseudomonadota bacterium]MCP4921854.1 hypothetical protein [Pseudomonadota bacterium]
MRLHAPVLLGSLFLLGCFGSISGDSGSQDSREPVEDQANAYLLVVDSSSSMMDESEELIGLADELLVDGATVSVTTVSVDDEAGATFAAPTSEPDELRNQLLCEATCWDPNAIPSDPNYECGAGFDQVSLQLLDCECGFEAWEGNCGSGNEEPLEAALLALCRASDDPPDACFLSVLSSSDVGTVQLADELIVLVVTDEGDSSRRLTSGDDDAGPYLEAIGEAHSDVTFAVMGPNYDADAGSLECNSGGATTWGTARLQQAAEMTGGLYAPISVDEGDCTHGDFEAFIEAVSAI